MPSRVVRGEILSSDSLSRVPLEAEAFFFRLLLAADDFGRLDGRLPVLRSLVFPARDVALDQVEGWLATLERADGESGPIVRYVVGGRPYIQLVNWERHRANAKRAQGSRFPSLESADPHGSPRASADPHPSDERRETRDEGRETSDEGAPPSGASAAPAAGRKTSITRIWELGIAAAALYRETAKTWVLTDARKKHVRALFSEHTAEGEEILAKVVHGYRYARRQWDDVEQHFEADTLLRASNRTKYLEAYREAIAKGLAPPFARARSTPATTDPARAARVDRDAEIQRLYRAGRLREATPAALAEWEAAGRPDVEWWWLPEAERRRVTPADIAALRGSAAPKQTASAPLSTAEVEAKRAELRGQARAVGGSA